MTDGRGGEAICQQIGNRIRNTGTAIDRGESGRGASRRRPGGQWNCNRGWSANAIGVSDVVALALIGSEEESLVLDDRAANAAAKLFQGARSFRGERIVEIVARVQDSIAAECERRAVQRIRSRLQSHIDDCTWFPSVLGCGILLNVELLDRIDGQDGRRIPRDTPAVDNSLTGKWFAIEQALNKVGMVFRAQTISARGGESTAGIAHHTGAKLQQILIVPPIQGKIVNFLIAQRSAERG